jgi:hypothetical protein
LKVSAFFDRLSDYCSKVKKYVQVTKGQKWIFHATAYAKWGISQDRAKGFPLPCDNVFKHFQAGSVSGFRKDWLQKVSNKELSTKTLCPASSIPVKPSQ